MSVLGKFKLKVINPDRMLFQGDVTTVFLQGDTCEFELLAYHYPVLSLLRQGQVVIDWSQYIPIRKGLVKFFKNDCTILVELDE